MKKITLFFIHLFFICCTVAVAANVTDVLTWEVLGLPGTTNGYNDFANIKVTSDAVYAGNAATGNGKYIQLNSSSPKGIITTQSGGKAQKVTVTWNEATIAGRTMNVYGKSEAYSSSSNLYTSSTQGTLLGTIVYGTTTELDINGDYEYIGLCSNSGALYLDQIEITWKETMTIAEAQAADAETICSVSGVVVATYTRGFLLHDETGYILYYNPAGSEYGVGDVLTVTGAVSKYGGLNQFTKTADIEKTGTQTVTQPAPVAMSGSDFDTYLTAPYIQYVTYTGTLTISGNYYNIEVAGASTAIAALAYPSADLIGDFASGDRIKVTGYLIYYTGSRYVYTLATEVASAWSELDYYYMPANGLSGSDLSVALCGIISNGHEPVTYSQLWTAFRQTDNTADGYVWDMYSDCTFTWRTDQCTAAEITGECDCYNREHSLPKSWWGGSDTEPMYTDIVHLVPTDGYVNAKRSNYAFGEVGNASYTSDGGSKLGSSNFSGYSGTVFEPVDKYKGDFARIYFYMVTRYRDVRFTSSYGSSMFTYTNSTANLTTYAVNLLLKWHRADPVSSKETQRNDAVEDVQGNRNPFVDHPELAEYLWGTQKGEIWYLNGTGLNTVQADKDAILANIALHGGQLTLVANAGQTVEYAIYGIDGRQLMRGAFSGQTDIATQRIGQGLFLLQVRNGQAAEVHKLLIH